ncbi:MAG: hypothetical protein HKUEN01_29410 [Candidatus Kuenenia stuttgartiensis]|jgi:hypothetical protein|nr:MAG: hypothetical protein HKUEN01_29410 [Candidatus Kuenenia stuttgartiensis]
MDEEKKTFQEYYNNRCKNDESGFFKRPVIRKAYFIGAYAKAVILSSWHSEVSKKNKTFKTWLSNQIINYRNLDRIFEMAFRFEQKLKLRIKNDYEVRKLAHEITAFNISGISSAKISFAFVAGFDDYGKFVSENATEINTGNNN